MVKPSEEKPKVPYATRKDTIKIFELIFKRKEPTTINEEKLRTLQMGSPKYVIILLKTLGFLDEGNKLNSSAENLRGTPEDFKKSLEKKVREIYNDLFNTVKDALNKEEETKVKDYFKTHFRDIKSSMLEKMTNCFLAMRDIVNSSGDFESLTSKEVKPRVREPAESKGKKSKTGLDHLGERHLRKPGAKNIQLTLNVNINLDVGTSKEAIEELFKNISIARETVFGENK
jgi:hypothetical protein